MRERERELEKLDGLSSPAAVVTVKLKNMAPVLEKFGCFNGSLVSTNSICAICILGARGQLLNHSRRIFFPSH